MMKAIIIGASGAVGKEVLHELLNEASITEVIALVRRPSLSSHSKLKQIVVDFDNLRNYATLMKADIAFACLGTTLKDAGSKKAQWKVDHDYQLQFAALCKEQGVKHFVLLSAAGVAKDSIFFYNKMKGTLEENVERLEFDQLNIVQPAMIIRPNTTRKMEKIIGNFIIGLNNIGLLRSYRSIGTEQLAKQIVKAGLSNSNTPVRRITVKDLFVSAI